MPVQSVKRLEQQWLTALASAPDLLADFFFFFLAAEGAAADEEEEEEAAASELVEIGAGACGARRAQVTTEPCVMPVKQR